MATAQELQVAGEFPSHLPAHQFEADAPIQPFLLDPNWVNSTAQLDVPVVVRFGNGKVEKTTHVAHLAKWMQVDNVMVIPSS